MNDKLKRLREWVSTQAKTLPEFPVKIDAGRFYAMDETLRKIDRLIAEPEAEPTKCEFCNGSLADGTDGHGLGECVPVCPTCDGSGTVEKCDWPGEHANRYQEPCPKCVAAPTDAEVEAAIADLMAECFSDGLDDRDDASQGAKDAFRLLRALIARRVAAAKADAPVTDKEVDEWQANMVAAAGGAADLPLVEKVVADGVRLMRRPKADDGLLAAAKAVLRDLGSINPNIRDATIDALNNAIAAREAGGAT